MSFLVFVKPVHLLNLGTQNAPDCVSVHLNFQNFAGGWPRTHPSCSRLQRSGWALRAQIVPPFVSRQLFFPTLCDVCGELKRKRNSIYKVPMDANEEIIASLQIYIPNIYCILVIIASEIKFSSQMPRPQRIVGI